MKKLFFLLLLNYSSAVAQPDISSREMQTENIDYFLRLGIEYIIKDIPSPDPEVIRNIRFDVYNRQRHSTLDLEFLDTNSNYVIILFSEEKCLFNKQQ